MRVVRGKTELSSIMPTFDGKVALVTGGASGIGRQVCSDLAQAGARVVVVDVDEERGREVEADLGRDAARFVRASVTEASEVKAAVQVALDDFGGLDCAFNNAGILGSVAGRVSTCTEANWDKVVGINLKGVWLSLKYEMLAMKKRGGGSIVCASSAAGMKGSFVSAPYTASKHAILGLVKSAAIEGAEKGIRVSAVCPGYIETPMLSAMTKLPKVEEALLAKVPAERFGTAKEVSDAVLWLMSDESSFVTGHALVVDGGMVIE